LIKSRRTFGGVQKAEDVRLQGKRQRAGVVSRKNAAQFPKRALQPRRFTA
jgi:hypothetical protein